MSDLSRRDVLGLAAAGILAPTWTQMSNRVLGQHMSNYYECQHDWLKPPKGLLWGDTHGLVQDAKGHIYVAHTVHPSSERPEALVVYSPEGEFITAWGADMRGGAHGLDRRVERGEEFLYHCDVNRNMVIKTDLSGRKAWEWKLKDAVPGIYKDGKAANPTNVAFHPDGNHFYVGDGYGSSYIHLFDREGKFVETLVQPGAGKGQVNCPHGLYIDSRGKEPLLSVADRGNRRIQYFSLDGKHVSFMTDHVRMPCHMHFNGDLMLVPDLESVVAVYDKNNQVLAYLGDGAPSNLRGRPRSEYRNGQFIHPHAAIWLNGNDILVAEWVPDGRITRLKHL